jgi:hypothetical protein
MAKAPSIVSLAAVLVFAALPGFASDTTYRDPRNPSFSVVVPDGWTAKRTDSGVNLSHGGSSALLLAVTGTRAPDDMVADIVSQIQKQGKNVRDMGKGECRFGGQKGSYWLFSGISPNGTAEVTKVVSMTNGQLVYTMVQEARTDEYEDEKRDLQRIQDSFAPEALPTAVDDNEKLDALYAAGVINQQEYEARKRNLGGSAGSQPSVGPRPQGNGNSAAGPGPRPTEPAPPAPMNPSNQSSQPAAPANSQGQRFVVVHFALSTTMNWMTDNCVGWMTIDNGMITYRAVRGTHGLHSFEIPVKDIKEAKRNTMMGSAFMAFHIRLKSGENYDFSMLDSSGQQLQNPTILLDAIHAAMH